MKILIISNFTPNVGGISVQVELLYKNLLNDGYSTRVFSTKASAIKRLLMIFKLWFVGRKYDVFHIHACSDRGFFPAVLGVIVGKLLKKRVVLTYHGGGCGAFFAKHPKFVRSFLCNTDANIVLSGYLASIFEEFNIPFHIIPNILEPNKNAYRERTEIRPKFISIRSLEEVYNIKCIIGAFQVVQRKFPSTTLCILGDGSRRGELEHFVEEQQINNIVFKGRVDNEQIYTFIDKADILLSSPLIDNQPVSLLEAFNAGLLVISSNVGGVPYMVQDGESGLLFESDNHLDLAEKMIFALEHQQQSLQMIHQAKMKLSYYSWDSIKNSLYGLYNSN